MQRAPSCTSVQVAAKPHSQCCHFHFLISDDKLSLSNPMHFQHHPAEAWVQRAMSCTNSRKAILLHIFLKQSTLPLSLSNSELKNHFLIYNKKLSLSNPMHFQHYGGTIQLKCECKEHQAAAKLSFYMYQYIIYSTLVPKWNIVKGITDLRVDCPQESCF